MSDDPGTLKATGLEDVRSPVGEESCVKLDHIGVAVRSLASARVFYEALGLSGDVEETVEREQVRSLMFSLGESRLELVEPTAEDSVIGRFLARRGEGMHHIALHVDDIDAKLEALKTRGVRLVNNSISIGAGGHRYFFVHPSSAGGVLVEIVGDPVEGKRHQV